MATTDRLLSSPGRAMMEQAEASDEISLADVWRALIDGKWIILIVTVFATATSITAAFLMTPIYRGEVLLAAREDDGGSAAGLGGQLGGLASLAGIRLDSGGDERTEAIAMLRSRTFAERFIREQELLPILFEDIWDSKNQTWLVDEPADVPTIRRAVRRFNDVRFVDEDTDTGLVMLAMEWKDPVLAAEWAGKYVAMLNAEMRASAIAEAEQSISYLQNEADKTSVVELKRVVYSLIEDQIRSIMLANVREQFAFQILDPAVVPEPNEQIRPKPRLMVVLGFIAGLMVGMFAVFFRNAIRFDKHL
jgi:uncharacterized protein involved in exopolysaccharide biosynthesis